MTIQKAFIRKNKRFFCCQPITGFEVSFGFLGFLQLEAVD